MTGQIKVNITMFVTSHRHIMSFANSHNKQSNPYHNINAITGFQLVIAMAIICYYDLVMSKCTHLPKKYKSTLGKIIPIGIYYL